MKSGKTFGPRELLECGGFITQWKLGKRQLRAWHESKPARDVQKRLDALARRQEENRAILAWAYAGGAAAALARVY